MRSSSKNFDSIAVALSEVGLDATLKKLNARTPFRFTGVYRFDGQVLRNVALYDRENPDLSRGGDAPLGETYCAITGRMNDALLVCDGKRDTRFAWMRGNSVVAYCGVPIRAEDGHALGTLCHFDQRPWPPQGEEAAYLLCIADAFRRFVLSTT